mgnify:FL=1
MLKICEESSVDYSIEFNASKSKLLVFGKTPSNVEVTLQGKKIAQVNCETHVGHLMSNSSSIQEQRISQACNTLIGQYNLLSRKLGFCSPCILYSLFQNYCMSLYGCQLWDYSCESLLESVFITWRKCVRNIFSIPYNTHCNLVHLIAQDSSVRVKLHRRYLKFFINMSNSKNPLVAMMSKIAVGGSRSAACRSINYISTMYGLCKYNLSVSDLSKLKDNDNECDIRTAGIALDFMGFYEMHRDQSVRDIVDYLCTS